VHLLLGQLVRELYQSPLPTRSTSLSWYQRDWYCTSVARDKGFRDLHSAGFDLVGTGEQLLLYVFHFGRQLLLYEFYGTAVL
jgi:hypothetical protein